MRNGHKMNDVNMVDSMINDGLTDAFHHIHMGNTGIISYLFIQLFNFIYKTPVIFYQYNNTTTAGYSFTF